jgi:5,6-dimethylbenzimidazole synthase
MSGGNAQPWEFIVVRDKETKDKMLKGQQESHRDGPAIERTRIEPLRHPAHNRTATQHSQWTDAPVVIVVCGDRRTVQATFLSANFGRNEGGNGTDGVYLKDMANPVQIMHLAVAALGLGSHWLTVNGIWEQSLRSILDVPPALDIHSIIVIGYPAYESPRPYRRELTEIVHYEKYDRNKYRSAEDIIEHLILTREHERGYTKPAYK